MRLLPDLLEELELVPSLLGERDRVVPRVLQWARLNDYFGDMIIDERFFDPDSERPEGLGDAGAERDYGAHPYLDTPTDPAFVSTRDLRWSARTADSEAPGRRGRANTAGAAVH